MKFCLADVSGKLCKSENLALGGQHLRRDVTETHSHVTSRNIFSCEPRDVIFKRVYSDQSRITRVRRVNAVAGSQSWA